MKLPDGAELIAHWREVGAWWEGETPLEIVQWRDRRGIRRERVRDLPFLTSAATLDTGQSEQTDHREDWSLRPRKIRDEKVRRACIGPEARPEIQVTSSPHPYVPLHIKSGYSFGHSLLFAGEIPRIAAEMGLSAAALTDSMALTGAMEFSRETRAVGIKPLIGSTFEMPEGGEIVLIAQTSAGYRSLSRLITACHLEEPRLYPLATWDRLAQWTTDLLCLTGGDGGALNLKLMGGFVREAEEMLNRLSRLYGRDRVFVEIERSYLPWQDRVNTALRSLAASAGLRCVAGGVATHRLRSDFPAQDILLCAETLCTAEEVIGRKPQRAPCQPVIASRPLRALNAERTLKTPDEMAALYADHPEELETTLRIADLCDADVMPQRTELPDLADDPHALLREATYRGASERCQRVGIGLKRRLDLELERIGRLGFTGHFLIAWDMCRWADRQKILFSGRGSVVDSAVAYCLGLSRIDAHAHRLLFDRFLPDDGSKRPDIDIDFEAHRRDDVRNYLIGRYGKDHVATVAAIGAYCTRGILREVGKVLGLPIDLINDLARKLHGSVTPDKLDRAIAERPEFAQANIPRERLIWVFHLAKQLTDIPRNMRAHSSGVVVSKTPLADTVPVIWSAGAGETNDGEMAAGHLRIVQWDKRSAKHVFDKFDILCLRGQDVLSGTQERIEVRGERFAVDRIPVEDPHALAAMRAGETIGIPQSASPAMRQAHQRLQTQNLADASLVQAGIRPGVGGAVKMNELIQRRRGLKPYAFDHPLLEEILGHTYGIVVFQEQIDLLLQKCCGYSSGEAEDIRDRIHKLRRIDYGETLKNELIDRARANGLSEKAARHVYIMVAGFKGYGFAQGHALAFAEISLRSIYCQQNYPAEYFASLLSAQPAGYYGPSTLANEARNRGVAILPVDINASLELFSAEHVRSKMDPTLELPWGGVRIGLMQVSGLSKNTIRRILQARTDRPFLHLADFIARVRPQRDECETLILAGALESLHANRRALLWSLPQIWTDAIALSGENALSFQLEPPSLHEAIADFHPVEKALRERLILGLDVEQHLMIFERERVASRAGITTAQARQLPHQRKAIVVGNPIRLRFPPTPSGRRVVFFDLEDETGLLNVTCFDETYRRDGHAIVSSRYVTIVGQAQHRDGHVAFLASRVFPYRPTIAQLLGPNDEIPLVTGDFLMR